jgi:hypothetical protein
MVMVFDLRLNKPPRKDPATIFHEGLNESNKEEGPVATRPMEERRAVLGCFVLSSMYVTIAVVTSIADGV